MLVAFRKFTEPLWIHVDRTILPFLKGCVACGFFCHLGVSVYEPDCVPTGAPRDAAESAATARARGIAFKIAKRGSDILFALALMPVMLTVAVALFCLNPFFNRGRLFYVQRRMGRDCQPFMALKFRTMTRSTEGERKPTAALERHRITPLGGILRRSRLDELPQIFNVLKGDMSLVGPRPMMPAQQALYPGQSYYELRPGITGSWQVSSRNECEFAARATYDDAYAREMSLAADARILAQTVGAVLRGTGC